MANPRKDALTISDQALLLLDDSGAISYKKNLDAFSSLENEIKNSFCDTVTTEITQHPVSNNFSVAARLTKSGYDDKARAEALVSALKKIRTRKSNYSSGRVIRPN